MNETASNEARVLLLNNWVVRVRPPSVAKSERVFLLLHGLTGDEHSMTIFTRNLPQDVWILSPRAPNQAEKSGYKWIQSEQGMIASFTEFEQVTKRLHDAFEGWKKALNIGGQSVEVIGFSQGAVIAGTFTLLFPEEVHLTGFLSGFLPNDTPEYISPGRLTGKSVFMAHGSQDKTVPIAKAQQTAAWLEQWGAQVTYCEAPVGHRMSANCFRGFADFFRNQA